MSRNSMDDITVLVTAAGAPGAVGIIESLRANRERGVRIIGTDMRMAASGRPFLDGFFQVPPGRDPDFIDSVIDICKRAGVDVILPLSTEELLAFASERERISDSCGSRVCVSPRGAVEASNEKAKLFQALGAAGVPVPTHRTISTANELRSAAETLGFPENLVCM